MDGFAWTATGGQVDFVCSAFNATNLPVLSALATNYAVFDSYWASVPTCEGGARRVCGTRAAAATAPRAARPPRPRRHKS